jgi:hypothetical protein
VVLVLVERDLKSSSFGCDPLRGVPFEVDCLPAGRNLGRTDDQRRVSFHFTPPNLHTFFLTPSSVLRASLHLAAVDSLVKIHRLPVRVVSGVERSSFRLELVREDKVVNLVRVLESPARLHLLRRVLIDEPKIPDNFWDLTRAVDAAEVAVREEREREES